MRDGDADGRADGEEGGGGGHGREGVTVRCGVVAGSAATKALEAIATRKSDARFIRRETTAIEFHPSREIFAS